MPHVFERLTRLALSVARRFNFLAMRYMYNPLPYTAFVF